MNNARERANRLMRKAEGKMKAKVWHITLVLVLLAGILAGCGTAVTSSETETSAVPADSGASEASTIAVLDKSYEGALAVSSQLALGTFQLEGTEQAITSEQAQALLPLWQVIESGSLTSEGETAAVLKQIEGAMTPEQLATIAAMQLTSEDMGTWAQEQGVSLGGPGDGTGGSALPEGMSQEDLDAMRAARQAGGEGGFAPPEGMSEEEREAMRATAEASGMTRPGGAGGMGAGQLAALAGPLVELLTELAHG
jgi:hypothetical protein